MRYLVRSLIGRAGSTICWLAATLPCFLGVVSCADTATQSPLGTTPSIGQTAILTVAPGAPANVVVDVTNSDQDEARIVVEFNGVPAVDQRFAGSGGSAHPPVLTFEFELPVGAVDVDVRAGNHSDSTLLNVTPSPQWIVVQNYGVESLGIDVTTFDERPLFG